MERIRVKSRLEWAAQAEGNGRQFSVAQLKQVLETEYLNGWVTVLPAVGPPTGKIPLIHAGQPLARLVCQFRHGSDRFPVAAIEQATGVKIRSIQAGRQLARVGLAIAGWDGEEVDLQAADPDLARLVNASRRRGAVVRSPAGPLVGLILAGNSAQRRRLALTEERRLLAWEAWLDQWEIRCDGLLDDGREVRLVSEWHLTAPEPGRTGKREAAHAG